MAEHEGVSVPTVGKHGLTALPRVVHSPFTGTLTPVALMNERHSGVTQQSIEEPILHRSRHPISGSDMARRRRAYHVSVGMNQVE
ncbi:MAG: hypothetical protein GXY44_08500 [Phycisphaerales bacterium]|nr:hypothetical protein [Phycisphaerales bacterium]